jgi:glyoxylate/hydroxypyruvate reductase
MNRDTGNPCSKDLLLAINGWDRASWLERFQRLMPERNVVLAGSDIDPGSVGYIACWKHIPGSLSQYTSTKVLFSLGAGVDHLITDPALPDAPVVRMVDPDLTARMSEWVVWQCLDWLRQGPVYRHQQSESLWLDDRHQPAARDVRVGVMGLGVLGQDAIGSLRQLRFDVAGWSRSEKRIDDVPTFWGESGLAAFLKRTDILVVLLPLTAQTAGLITMDLLHQLAKNGRLGGPILINAGRGGLHVEADILSALDAGWLRGASLDVFETEPLPVASRFWQHPAVFVSPHNAAMSHPDSIARTITAQIMAFEKNGALQNNVERQRGY